MMCWLPVPPANPHFVFRSSARPRPTCRDIKLENIFIDDAGRVKLVSQEGGQRGRCP